MARVRFVAALAALIGVILVALGVYKLIWSDEPAAAVIGLVTGVVLVGTAFLYRRAPTQTPADTSPGAGTAPGSERRVTVALVGLVASIVVGGFVSAATDLPLLLVATPLAVAMLALLTWRQAMAESKSFWDVAARGLRRRS